VKWERTVTVIGCHVGGEDNHVIVGESCRRRAATMFEKKRYLEDSGRRSCAAGSCSSRAGSRRSA